MNVENAGKRWARMPRALRWTLRQLAWCGAGFLLARTRLFDGLPSFALALTAAAPGGSVFAACAGAAAGALAFAPDLLTGLTGTAAVIACGVICFALQTITGTPRTPLTSFFIAALCCCTAGFTTLLAAGFYRSGVLLYLCDAILAGGAAFFLMHAYALVPMLRRPSVPSAEEALAVSAAMSILLASAASWTVYVFVPARALAALAILLAAYLFGQAGGGAAGVLCGTAMEIVCRSPGLACCFGVGGLLSGLCSRRARAWTAACMAVIVGFYPLLMQTNDAVAAFAETCLACAAFCAVPKRYLQTIRRKVAAISLEKPVAAAMQNRLRTTSRAVSHIAPYLDAQQLRQGRAPGTKRMLKRVHALACSDCAQCTQCWQTDETATTEALSGAFVLLHRKQFLSPELLPEPLVSRCIRRNILVAACVQAFEESSNSVSAPDSFAIACDLLEDAAEQCGEIQQTLPQDSVAAEQVFRANGVAVRSARVTTLRGRKYLTATSEPFPETLSKTALTDALSKICACAFSLPTISAEGDVFRWQFVQTARYRLRTGTAQSAADGKVCGDCFLTFAREGRQTMILCDGMGTGSAAAADAEAAAEIFASLLRADVHADCAFRVLNSALLRREDVESVSTLDMVVVDLFTGETTFSKAGAAASYVLHKGKVDRVETPCMPAGILPETSLAHTTRTLQSGDVFVLVSDGVCAMRDDHILAALAGFRGGSAQKLAEEILRLSNRAYGKKRPDDATVLAVVVE